MYDLLREFGQSVGLPDLAFDENDYCCLLLDDLVLNLELDEETEMLFVYAHVGKIPPEPTADFYAMLLEANYFYRQTAGGVLGIDKATGVIALACRQPYAGLTLIQFEKVIEDFANAADHWTQQITATSAGSTDHVDWSMESYIRA